MGATMKHHEARGYQDGLWNTYNGGALSAWWTDAAARAAYDVGYEQGTEERDRLAAREARGMVVDTCPVCGHDRYNWRGPFASAVAWCPYDGEDDHTSQHAVPIDAATILADLLAASQSDHAWKITQTNGTIHRRAYVWGFDAELGAVHLGTRTESCATVLVANIVKVEDAREGTR